MFELYQLAITALIGLSLAGYLLINRLQGQAHELSIDTVLTCELDPDAYHLYQQLQIPTEEGSVTIDAIIISRFGVFLIESIEIEGIAYINGNSEHWSIEQGGNCWFIGSPHVQTRRHATILQAYLKLEESMLHPITLLKGEIRGSSLDQGICSSVDALIRNIHAFREPCLGEPEINDIERAVAKLKVQAKLNANEQRHASTSEEEGVELSQSCPKCGQMMILSRDKRDKHGHFWLCPSYPDCSSALAIDEPEQALSSPALTP